MAQLSLQDIERLAMLTRLEIGPAQAQEALTHINQFFDLVEKMSATDTSGIERTRQKALFFVSALVGLAVTMAIVGMGTIAGIWPLATKAIAVVVSFQITYILRKRIVFAA